MEVQNSRVEFRKGEKMRTRKRKPHRALILTVSLTWLILSANAAASDWFVRPSGGSYGTEDGSSYQDAWDGLQNVVWGPGGVEAGDDLYVCGLHLRTGSTSWEIFTPGANGVSEDSRIIIRGDYPDDQGIIWGAGIMAHEDWVDEGNNTWSITELRAPNSIWYFEDITTDSWRVLDYVASLAELQATPGSYYSDSNFDPNITAGTVKFYVHTSDNGNPTNRIAANRLGYRMRLKDNHYITWKNLEFYSLYRWVDLYQSAEDHISYIKWENTTIWYGDNYHVIWFNNYHHHLELIDCDIAFGSNGICFMEYPREGGTHHIVIRGCKIHDIGLGRQANSDAHAFSSYGLKYSLIEKNEMYNVGSGITFYEFHDTSGEQTSMKDVIVRWNWIHDTHTLAGANSRGIEFNMDVDNTADKSGNKCYGNIVGPNVSGHGYRTTWEEYEVDFYNNVAYNCGISFYFYHTYQDDIGPNVKLRNNISFNPGTYHIYFKTDESAGEYTIDSNYNNFYPTLGDLFYFYDEVNQAAITLTEWQALSKNGCTFDPNSIVADPLFVDPENGNFHLWSDSPAINAGVDVGLTQDFEGNPIPQGPAPDIGAYECVLDPNNPTPELQAIGDKSVDENVTLTFDVNATDPNNEPITYSVQSLPSGATFSIQTFSWTPSYDQAGSYQVRFIASDGNSNDSETITITVNNVNRAPVLGPIGNQSVNENALLSFSVSATDADGEAITYSVTGGLPSGAVFASQTFTWTPSYDQAGIYSVTFTADDGQAQDSETITITVINVNRAPVLTAIDNQSAYADVLLTFTIDATDPDGDAITYSAGTLPSGATFTDQDFDWTPSQSQVGSYAVTFIASDGQLQDSETVTITVDVDSLATTVTNCSPAAGSIQVPTNNLITLNIADAGIGVDAATVTIEVNNNIVYTSGASPDGNCQRLGTKADYTFVYQSNEMFDYDQTVIITVNATDLAGNAMNEHSYSFVTEMRSFGQNKQVNSGLDNNDRPVTVCDSSGNIWSAWQAGPIDNRDIYISKLTAGEENFNSTIQLTNNANDQCNPAIALDSNDKLYVVWQDNREGDWDIYVSTSVDGISWSTETRVNDPNEGNQVNPAIVIDGQDFAHVVWQDDHAGNQDIYLSTSSDGFVTTTVSQITSHVSDQVEPAVAADSAYTIYVVWTDMRNGSNDIYGAASNNPWTNGAIVSNANNQSSPAIAAESAGSILHLLWVDDTSGDNDIYYASSDGLPGSPLTGSSIIDDTSGANQLDPTIAVIGRTDNNLKVFACWQDWRNTDTDLYFAELSAGSGTNIFVDDGGSNAYQGEPTIGIGEYGHPYIMWADSRSTNTDIYYAGSTFIEPVALASELVSASASSSTTVGTDPQAITTVDDVSVVVPAGACSYDVAITVTKIANLPEFAAPCLGGYDFGPSGIQFSQPVTITIPYVFSGSDGSVTPYWFNSLTGALSQQGITDIQDIPISSSLHALSFKTTHFTAFYLFAGGGAAAIVSGGGGGGGCSVSASGEGNIVEYILPYIGLAVVMTILKMRDIRDRKARNITAGKC